MKTENRKLKVAVLMGGIGSEREVSIQSGTCVAEALLSAGYDVVTADVAPDRLEILGDESVDVFFPVLHGEFGEDGQLQRILEEKCLVYVGSGPVASDRAFDKMAAKEAFSNGGVLTPAAIRFEESIDAAMFAERIGSCADNYVVKPIRQGSSVGVSIVSGIDDAIETACRTAEEFGDCMIEEFIAGRELTVGILCDEALPIIEIRPKTGFYDYHAKYIDEQTGFLFDTISDADLVSQVQGAALDCFEALGCRDFGRADFMLSEDNRAYALEVNTIPGFTSHSLLPKAAEKAGLSMADLCTRIVETAGSTIQKRS